MWWPSWSWGGGATSMVIVARLVVAVVSRKVTSERGMGPTWRLVDLTVIVRITCRSGTPGKC